MRHDTGSHPASALRFAEAEEALVIRDGYWETLALIAR